MDREPIDELQLRAIVDHEVRSAMGEIGGELAEERTTAMDYYLGEPVGKLSNPAPDRSNVVITTVRDTVEWLMPQLIRLFAQADNVVEFEPLSQEDEEAAEQEIKAINHIFWRKNEGFLILFTWFKDALLQKNGIVKFWIDETEDKARDEYDGVTDLKLAEMLNDPELEAVEHDVSEITGVNGEQLHHVVFERTSVEKSIIVEPIPPEEFLISNDARSLDMQKDCPRFVGHYTEKTLTELRDMGFSEDDIEAMKRGDERWDELDEEWIARYHLSDEQEISDRYAHESMRQLRIIEAYMRLDINGDGYAELVKIFRVGEFISYEEVDHIPFSALTPNILSHKFFGLSIFDLVHDLQEIATATTRNVLDNMYQVNNTRPVVNERVDTDSLLTSRPGAPIYVDDELPVDGAIAPFAPPPMWKDGLGLLEYLDGVRKDRTGVGDETMGLDPQSLANANTGVVLSAIEAARGKIELIARIFAETGIKWLFRGIHELARKSYDQPLRYKMASNYVEVNPQEWRKRTDMVVNVGTATGSRQQDQFALTQIGQIQEKMAAGGLMGRTVLPSQIYETAKDMAETLGQHGDKYFLNPMMLQDPQIQQMVQAQMPQPGPDPQSEGIKAMAQAEQMKAQVANKKIDTEAQLKAKEIDLRHLEASGKEELAMMKQQLEEAKSQTDFRSQQDKIQADVAIKSVDAEIRLREQALKGEIAQLQAEVDMLKTTAQLAADTANQNADRIQKEDELALKISDMVFKQMQAVRQESSDVDRSTSDIAGLVQALPDAISAALSKSMSENVNRPRPISYDEGGRIISIG